MTEITPSSQIRAHERCPRCGTSDVSHNSTIQDTSAIDGTSLWVFAERCIMCDWTKTTSHVKIGA